MARILVIDDQPLVRDVLRRILESAGHGVEEAGDGEQGLQAFRRQPPDLVLCDIYMTSKGGLETIRVLRRDFPAAKVVAMSGGGFEGKFEVLAMAEELGAAATIEKPFILEELLAVVEAVLQLSP
jgi:CheY-like chemotaxis protein